MTPNHGDSSSDKQRLEDLSTDFEGSEEHFTSRDENVERSGFDSDSVRSRWKLGNGVGGAGVHWNAETWRFLPTDFTLKSHLTQRYGASFLPDDMTIQDWGVSFDELEPHYDEFEYLCGTSGQAGNLGGAIQAGGNPFEGPRSRPYPTPPQKQGYGHTLFAQAATQLGYKPFPQPSGNLSRSYTNPLGVTLGQCTYCGFCEWFGCANYSKASPQTTILPVLLRKSNFEARTECEVTRINLDNTG